MKDIQKIGMHLVKYLLLIFTLSMSFANEEKLRPPLVQGNVINPVKTSPKGIVYSAYPITNEGDLVRVASRLYIDTSLLENPKLSYIKVSLAPYSYVGSAEFISEPIVIKASEIKEKTDKYGFSDNMTFAFTIKGEGLFCGHLGVRFYDENHNLLASDVGMSIYTLAYQGKIFTGDPNHNSFIGVLGLLANYLAYKDLGLMINNDYSIEPNKLVSYDYLPFLSVPKQANEISQIEKAALKKFDDLVDYFKQKKGVYENSSNILYINKQYEQYYKEKIKNAEEYLESPSAKNNFLKENTVVNSIKTSPKNMAYSAYPIVKEGEFVHITNRFKIRFDLLESHEPKIDYIKIFILPALYSGKAELVSDPAIIKVAEIPKDKIIDNEYVDNVTLAFTLKGEGEFESFLRFEFYDKDDKLVFRQEGGSFFNLIYQGKILTVANDPKYPTFRAMFLLTNYVTFKDKGLVVHDDYSIEANSLVPYDYVPAFFEGRGNGATVYPIEEEAFRKIVDLADYLNQKAQEAQ